MVRVVSRGLGGQRLPAAGSCGTRVRAGARVGNRAVVGQVGAGAGTLR